MSERFEVSQFEDGQIFISEDGQPRLHARIRGYNDVEVQIGAEGVVEVDKLYGPLAMMPVRLRVDFEQAEWVLERYHPDADEFREAARVPGQLDSDFGEVSA